MAEHVLSAFVNFVTEKLVTATLNQLFPSTEIHTELKKWERLLSQVRMLLDYASDKEVTSEAVQQWHNSLQHLAYDIEDSIDGLTTDAMHRELTNESEPTSKVRKFLSTYFSRFSSSSTSMDSKLSDITTRLQELVDEKNNFGLGVKEGKSKDKNRRYQTSLLEAHRIVGREGDKRKLLDKLLVDEPRSQNFSIVPIVGMGGMGKTTLARILYNDRQVKDHFELKAWVCVSDEFDSFDISKAIFQCVGGENTELGSLDLLQVALRDRLRGKRFLLVLDDVWSDKIEDWDTLAGPFSAGARGSKIIITSRKKELLRQLGHDLPYDLQKLSLDDALKLLAQYAGINDFDLYPMLKPHGKGIVQKCNGLPLALEAVGRSLRTKRGEEDWKKLNNEIWRLQDGGGIVPALRLSYQDLSACLKQLFAYCCLFPKDYVFNKDDLILLWMAEGFLYESATKSMEQLGKEYFEELLSRSFFQHHPDDESLFVMHNDLATCVAGEFFILLDVDMEINDGNEAFKKYRHMSFDRESYITYEKLKAFETANSLRTFLAVPIVVRNERNKFDLSSKILVDILPKLQLLRVLCLSGLEIDEVPESVGNMKHLRYLNLSQTRITHLPVCNLYNLQTLIVSGCEKLTKLPDNFIKLQNLRHFDIRDTYLWNMLPLGIVELKSLQILCNIRDTPHIGT